MNVRDSLRALLAPMPEPGPVTDNDWRTATAIEARRERRIAARAIDSFTDYPGWTEQVLSAFGLQDRPWRVQSVSQALGVPAIFRSVSLIANTVGSLSVETYRNGQKLEGADVPRIVTRPDPFKTPNKFYRDTTFYLATRGECWWWIAKRDADGLPMSLIVIPPWEIAIDPTSNRLQPKITWNVAGKSIEMDPFDLRQMTYLPDPLTLRGLGPLQACGAAVSAAVESMDWAANFYAGGGYPSIIIKAAGRLGDNSDGDDSVKEADVLRDQWMGKDHNTPRIIDEGIEDVKEFGVNPQGAQMLDARVQSRGDVANMFGIPGPLLEYSVAGSSLTYQSIPDVFRNFVKTCLAPNYLEAIEQELSDLLPRSITARFNVAGFDRADPESRWRTYQLAASVIGVEEAAQWARTAEGFAPGDIEFAPVPFAPPSAFPTRLPATRTAEPVRCTGTRVLKGLRRPCGKLLAEAGPFIGRCPRCGAAYEGAA